MNTVEKIFLGLALLVGSISQADELQEIEKRKAELIEKVQNVNPAENEWLAQLNGLWKNESFCIPNKAEPADIGYKYFGEMPFYSSLGMYFDTQKLLVIKGDIIFSDSLCTKPLFVKHWPDHYQKFGLLDDTSDFRDGQKLHVELLNDKTAKLLTVLGVTPSAIYNLEGFLGYSEIEATVEGENTFTWHQGSKYVSDHVRSMRRVSTKKLSTYTDYELFRLYKLN